MGKNKKIKKKKNMGWFNLAVFLLGLQRALVLYVLSSFIQNVTGINNIGVFFFIAYAAAFYVLINFHHLIKRHGKSRMLMMFLVIKIFALVMMAIYANSMIAVIFIVWMLLCDVLIWAGFDIILENYTENGETGLVRGIGLTLFDGGFLFGPIIAAWMISHFGFWLVFSSSAFIASVTLAIIFFKYGNINHTLKKDPSIAKVLSKMLKKPNLIRVYYISFMLRLFYVVMAIYIPLYLLEIGFSWIEIGKIITVMLIPFVVMQIPLGILADKKTGEKELIILGIIILVFSTGAISLFSSTSIYFWMVILVSTRIGAAMLQVMLDTYFYKKIGPSDVELIDFFRTTLSVSYVTGMIISSMFLALFSLKMLFIMFAVLFFTALAPALKLHDTR